MTATPPYRSYSFTGNVTNMGAKQATVQLTKADSNAANNWDDAVVTPFVTCAAPFGLLAARPACPTGWVYVGPDNTTLANSTVFSSTCCVSMVYSTAMIAQQQCVCV